MNYLHSADMLGLDVTEIFSETLPMTYAPLNGGLQDKPEASTVGGMWSLAFPEYAERMKAITVATLRACCSVNMLKGL